MLWMIFALSVSMTTGLIIDNGWVSSFYDLWIPIVLVIVLNILFSVIVALLMILWSLFVDMNKTVTKRSWLCDFVVESSAKILMFYGRIKLHTKGLEKIPNNARFMVICNHRSMMDPLILIAKLAKYKISFVSKKSVFKIPFVNKYMHKSGFISLDRDDMRDAVKMINQAVALVGNTPSSIAIYPEGTRNTRDELLEFKSGAFKIVLKAKLPLVVTTIRNSELVAKRFPFRSTHVYLNVLGFLPYEEIKELSTKEISEKVKKMMEEDLENSHENNRKNKKTR